MNVASKIVQVKHCCLQQRKLGGVDEMGKQILEGVGAIGVEMRPFRPLQYRALVRVACEFICMGD